MINQSRKSIQSDHIVSTKLLGAGSLADNKENMTKMEEPATPSKRGDLKEKRKLFGSSKSINSVTK